MKATTPEPISKGDSARELAEVTTLVVDDQRSFRSAMKHLVSATPGFSLVGEASSGEDALTAVDSLMPRLVLMDVRMPGIGGLQAALTLARRHPPVTVILVSVHGPEELPHELVGDKAAALVLKQDLRPRLLRELWEEHRPREDADQAI